ncbi:hypothetical protein N7532_003140 [Penicillium argentinense]|uniref:BZIP domain-containing protein n=1 Tax=Penicillium argentinense TaxID=1131581 RepID=A0A9W9FLV0_9EURO|nr:uncharacterized protein N7532_003140 [Penicillium argentinense]KAJ5102611.1 hypothetical protein N7532_003140 [Penicillium argentinense]
MAPSNNQTKHAPGNTDVEKRKLRNRLAQRAFRRRQADHLRELRDRASSSNLPQDEKIQKLQEENSRLRKSLIDVHAKLSRLSANMHSWSEAISSSIDELTSPKEKTSSNEPSFNLSNILEEFEAGAIEDEIVCVHGPADAQQIVVPSRSPKATSPISTLNIPEPISRLLEAPLGAEDISARVSSLAQEIPSIWSFEYQMGQDPYTKALSSNQSSRMIMGKDWTETNSPFSDHIQILRQVLKGKVELNRPATGPAMLFLTRPDVMKWYAKTRFYHIVNLTAWQINPCTKTYNSIHPQYRPTSFQLQRQYPSVIDWIPFPSIRDRLIQLHSANPQIDQIFCDTVSSYVVETWMSDLIIGAPTIKAYIRITDIIANFDSKVEEDPAILAAALPAPDIATIFASPICSRAVFKKLNMACGVSNYKIDPSFLEAILSSTIRIMTLQRKGFHYGRMCSAA